MYIIHAHIFVELQYSRKKEPRPSVLRSLITHWRAAICTDRKITSTLPPLDRQTRICSTTTRRQQSTPSIAEDLITLAEEYLTRSAFLRLYCV